MLNKYPILIVVFILIFASCSKDYDDLNLYQEYQGGILFYFLQEGDLGYVPGELHGLIASFEDLSTSEGEFEVPWGCCKEIPCDENFNCTDCLDIPDSENEEIGMGKQNTQAILAACTEKDIAAQLCDEYSIEYEDDIYDDWYLPSFEEIRKMNRPKKYLLDHSLYYWTSTQETRGMKSNEYAIVVFGWVDQCSEPYDPRDPEGCWHVGFIGGDPKYYKNRVRAIRRF